MAKKSNQTENFLQVGNGAHTEADGTVYHKGDVVPSEVNLAEAFPTKFKSSDEVKAAKKAVTQAQFQFKTDD